MPHLPRASALALAFGLAAASIPARAWEPAPWTRADTLWELGYLAAVAMDCGQSVQLDQPGRYERNPLLPRHPSPRTVRMICLGSVVGHFAVSYVLPAPWRRRFQVVTVALEAAAVTDNYFRARLSIRF